MESKRINSIKRNAILDVLMNTKEHPSAEMIYNAIKDQFPKVSLGTVYRNLSVLSENGDIICVGVVDGKERFDAVTKPHSHFVCKNCFRVLDVDMPFEVSDLFQNIKSTYGFEPDDYQLEFHGLCDKCSS